MRAHLRDVPVEGGAALVGAMLVLTLILWAAWPIVPFGGIASGRKCAR